MPTQLFLNNPLETVRRRRLYNDRTEQLNLPQEDKRMFIRDVIQDREPYSLNETASVLEAAEFMATRRIGAVCVLDRDGKLIGVFSERDLLNRVVVPRSDPASMKLGEVTSPLRAEIGRASCRERVY